MHISFNGVIRPYTYNCPHAHRLRNIERIFPRDVLGKSEEKNEEEVGDSRRTFGIDQHELAAQYIDGEDVDFNYSTATIEFLRDNPHVQVEKQKFFTLDLEPIPCMPEDRAENFISIRSDALYNDRVEGRVYDLKFGNPDYGQVIYYDEVEFFLTMEAIAAPEVNEWSVHIHFPIHDYTLPVKRYSLGRISRLQTRWLTRIDRILSDKYMVPEPSTVHCRLCDYRSIEAGGCGVCEHSIL
jgi:hypothetical protein